LNGVPDAATTQILLGPPGIELGTRGFDDPDAGDAARLFSLAPAIPEARRFSRVHWGRGKLLDQILASEEFFPRGSRQPRRVRRRAAVDRSRAGRPRRRACARPRAGERHIRVLNGWRPGGEKRAGTAGGACAIKLATAVGPRGAAKKAIRFRPPTGIANADFSRPRNPSKKVPF
jgi:hypothetical protein